MTTNKQASKQEIKPGRVAFRYRRRWVLVVLFSGPADMDEGVAVGTALIQLILLRFLSRAVGWDNAIAAVVPRVGGFGVAEAGR